MYVIELAIDLFEGNAFEAMKWYNTPCRALGDISPKEAVEVYGEEDEVINLIGRLEHGVFS